jgi:hypothetical protein
MNFAAHFKFEDCIKPVEAYLLDCGMITLL